MIIQLRLIKSANEVKLSLCTKQTPIILIKIFLEIKALWNMCVYTYSNYDFLSFPPTLNNAETTCSFYEWIQHKFF